MKRNLDKKEDGVTHVIEFTIALTVFVLLVQAFTSSMNHRIGIDLDINDDKVVMAREAISELAGSEGKVGELTNWEDFEFGTGDPQLRNGVNVGILNSNGEIDKDKCNALGKFPYFSLKNELGVTDELRIEVKTLVPSEIVCLWGGELDGASVSIQSEKYLLYNTGSEVVPALLTVTVYNGQVPGNKVYMTEVMYNPTVNGDSYEWVEVYNPNPVSIYIETWKISDSVDEDIITNDEDGDDLVLLPAKTTGILTSSITTYKETYGDYQYVFSVEDNAIGNGLGKNETLVLSKGSFKDTFSYTSEDGADGNGKTLTRTCYDCEIWEEAVASPTTID